jgi:hypothetical protein
LRANRITPAGCTRLSREASPADISVPSNPMISSWPMRSPSDGSIVRFVFLRLAIANPP